MFNSVAHYVICFCFWYVLVHGYSLGMCSCKKFPLLSCFLNQLILLFFHFFTWVCLKAYKVSPKGEVPPSGTTSCSRLCGSVTAYCSGPDHLQFASTRAGYPSGCVLQLTHNHLVIIIHLNAAVVGSWIIHIICLQVQYCIHCWWWDYSLNCLGEGYSVLLVPVPPRWLV